MWAWLPLQLSTMRHLFVFILASAIRLFSVLSAQMDCSTAINLDIAETGMACVSGMRTADSERDDNPDFIDPCGGAGNADEFWWGRFTARSDMTYFQLWDISNDAVSMIVYEGDCTSLTDIVCIDDLRDRGMPASYEINTVAGQDYFVLFQHDSRFDLDFCLFDLPDQSDRDFCDENLSFESGSLFGWQRTAGSFHFENNCPDAGEVWDFFQGNVGEPRFELLSKSYDPFVGPLLPRVWPEGGRHSLRIGSDEGDTDQQNSTTVVGDHASAEQAQQCFTVTEENAGFGFSYAVVLAQSEHFDREQPLFEAFFTRGEDTLDCGQYELFVGDGYTQFSESPVNDEILYSYWQVISTDLSAYVGDEVCVHFRVHDCEVTNSMSSIFVSIVQDNAPTDSIFLEFSTGDEIIFDQGFFEEVDTLDAIATITGASSLIFDGQVVVLDPSEIYLVSDRGIYLDGELIFYWGTCNHRFGAHWIYAYVDTYCESIEILQEEFCANNDEIVLCAPEGYTEYEWISGPNLPADTRQQCITITDPEEGQVYEVSMLSVTTGCRITRDIELQFIPFEIEGDTSICLGTGSTDLGVSLMTDMGPYFYQWNTGSMDSVITVDAPGEYSVLVTNTRGCESMQTIEVRESQLAISCEEQSPSSDPGSSDGVIRIEVTGAIGPVTLRYVGPREGEVISSENDVIIIGLQCGVYNIIAVDESGCEATCTVGVNCGNCGFDVVVTSLNSCEDMCGGQVILEATGDNNFLWPDGSVDSARSDLCADAYAVTVSRANCQEIIFLDVFSDPVPEIILDDVDILSCEQETITLRGMGQDLLTSFWINIDGDTISRTEEVMVSAAGMYTYLLVDPSTLCMSDSTIEVLADRDTPRVDAGLDRALACDMDEINISLSGALDQNLFYDLMSLDGHAISQSSAREFQVTEAGIYVAEVVNTDNGCRSTDTVVVSAEAIIEAFFQLVHPECIGAAGILILDSLVGGSEPYEIFIDGVNIPIGDSIFDLEIGLYELMIMDDGMCSVEYDINIEPSENSLNLFASSTSPVCPDDTLGSIAIDSIFNAVEPLMYSLNGEIVTDLSVLNNLIAGRYFLELMDDRGCLDTLTLSIQNASPLSLNLGPDIFLEEGDDVLLVPTIIGADSFMSISWSPSSGLDCTDCLEVTASPTESVIYQLDLISANGCLLTDSIRIILRASQDVYIPNIFSPNADGINDVFEIFTEDEAAQVRSMQIYDRWGSMVFEAEGFRPNETVIGWDGMFKAQLSPVGVYSYSIEIEFSDASAERYTGDLTLIR